MHPHLEFYPCVDDGRFSEVWHGEKMVCGHNRDQLTPMAGHNGRVYFVNEVCDLTTGSLFLIKMFLRKDGALWARGHMLLPGSTVSLFFAFDE